MKNKFILSLFCVLGIACSVTHGYAKQDNKINIVATSFHEFDWVSQIIKGKEEHFKVELLLDNGIDIHSYQPSVQDIALISSSDFFIHNGGASDAWMHELAENALNPDLVVFNVMEKLGDSVKMEVKIEGMQENHAHHNHGGNHGEHDDHSEHAHREKHEHHDKHGHHEEHEHHEERGHHEEHAHHDKHDESEGHSVGGHEDEHVWLSLKNAIEVCELLEDAISELDPQNEAVYEKNTEAYIKELKELDNAFQVAIDDLPHSTLIFADRFPFLYMMNDYDINYYAAFQACSAETEASFETVSFLSQKSDEYNVNYILIIDDGLENLAKTIINNSENTQRKILTLNSLQSIKQDDIKAGVSYISLMQDNLDILKQALK